MLVSVLLLLTQILNRLFKCFLLLNDVIMFGLRITTSNNCFIVILHISLFFVSQSTTENILVFLFFEIDWIISMWMRVHQGIVLIILPGRAWVQVLSNTIIPSLQLKVTNWSSLVVVWDLHCSSIGIVINDFSPQCPLLFLSETFKDMIWTNLHNADFIVEAGLLTFSIFTSSILDDFSVATARNNTWDKGHEFWSSSGLVAETTVFMTEGFTFTVRIPVVVGLIVTMVLVEGVIQVTIHPCKLRNVTQEEWHLWEIIWVVIVPSSYWIELLVGIAMDKLVTPIIVRLLPIILWHIRAIKVEGHILKLLIINNRFILSHI